MLRKFYPKDKEQVRQLKKLCYEQSMGIGEKAARYMTSSDHDLGTRLLNEKTHSFVWEHSGRIVAVGALDDHGCWGELHSGYVLPTYQSQGIGTRMLTHRFEVAEEIGLRHLVTYSFLNSAEMKLKHGFGIKKIIEMDITNHNKYVGQKYYPVIGENWRSFKNTENKLVVFEYLKSLR